MIHEITLDKNVPVPLYYQLKRQMLSLIETARLREGDILPPESEFCAFLGVSRPTIRQAFNELVAEGYLNRYKGRGTFVSMPKVEERFLSKLETFNDEMLAKRMTPSTQVLALEKKMGPHEANERLIIPLDSPLIYLSRLRSANGVPLVYVETYLSFDRFPRLMDVDFNDKSLYDSLMELYHVHVSHALREIEAINARRKEAELLNIAPNKAVTLVKTISYGDNMPYPVEFSVARYSGELNKFTVDIHR